MKKTIFLTIYSLFLTNIIFSQDAGITNPANNLIIHNDNRSSYFLTNDLSEILIDGWSNTGQISSIKLYVKNASVNQSSFSFVGNVNNANSGTWDKTISIDPGVNEIYINVRCNYAGCLQAGTDSDITTFTYVKPYEIGDFYLETTTDNKVKITLFSDYGIGGLNTGFYYRVFRNTTASFSGGTFIGNWSQSTEIIDNNVNSGITYYYWVDVAKDNSGTYNSGLVLGENRSITTSTLSIEKNGLLKQVKLLPNPTSSKITIQTPNSVLIKELILYNVQGKFVKKEKEQTKNIDISNLSAGIYFVKVITNQGVAIKKLLKTKF